MKHGQHRRFRALVVGCSAGGLDALQHLLRSLTGPLPMPLVIVCHSGSEDMSVFCDLLQRCSSMPVSEAAERQLPKSGHVHVAPSGYHLLIEKDGRFALSVDPKVEFSRPAINILFETAAEAWGESLLAVLMTGANADGARGLARIRERGGHAIVQDPDTAYAPAMPAAAMAQAGADHCVPLDAIAPLLESLCLQ